MTESARILAVTIAAVMALQMHSGVASQYAPNVMERVFANRLAMGEEAR